MAAVKKGDKISIHYTGKKEDDTTIGTSIGREPLALVVGENSVFPGLENELIGMEVGAKKTVTLHPEEAFGPYREEFVRDFQKNQFPGDVTLEVGNEITLKSEDGTTVPVRITEVAEDTVTLDANHPLAGQTLQFDIEVVAIAD